MNGSRDSYWDTYWDLETCAWVECTQPVNVPVQGSARPTDDEFDPAEVEQQYGVPV